LLGKRPLATKVKLTEDFKNLNLKIEKVAKEEILRIRQEADMLKDKALKMGEALTYSNPPANDTKSSSPRKT
jgi:hypothetical protein